MACPSKEHHKRAWIQWPLCHVAGHWFAPSFPPFRPPRFKVRSDYSRKGPNFGSTNEGSKSQMITKILTHPRIGFRAGDKHNMFALAMFDVLSFFLNLKISLYSKDCRPDTNHGNLFQPWLLLPTKPYLPLVKHWGKERSKWLQIAVCHRLLQRWARPAHGLGKFGCPAVFDCDSVLQSACIHVWHP